MRIDPATPMYAMPVYEIGRRLKIPGVSIREIVWDPNSLSPTLRRRVAAMLKARVLTGGHRSKARPVAQMLGKMTGLHIEASSSDNYIYIPGALLDQCVPGTTSTLREALIQRLMQAVAVVSMTTQGGTSSWQISRLKSGIQELRAVTPEGSFSMYYYGSHDDPTLFTDMGALMKAVIAGDTTQEACVTRALALLHETAPFTIQFEYLSQ